MCSCDEYIGRKFLSHQLREGVELETQQRIPVTDGFQPGVCRECKGLPPETHPVASIPGRTSKIRRYYWRELAFREMELFAKWAETRGLDPNHATGPEASQARKLAKKQAVEEIKRLHETQQKYTFREVSQAEIIRKYRVKVVDLKATYVKGVIGRGKARVVDDMEVVSPEEFAGRHYSRQGFEVLALESVPFHVLFGVYMWLVIQDPADPRLRIVGFGDRNAFDTGTKGQQIWTPLPDDFGSPGYGQRREAAIEHHLSADLHNRDRLEWLFDYWLDNSEDFRQYLWAHRTFDIDKASQLITILSPKTICEILKYLAGDYWRRYCGWPDLLVHKKHEYFLAEVKGAGDKLSDAQKDWIKGNHEVLKIPFKLVKIHKTGSVDPPGVAA